MIYGPAKKSTRGPRWLSGLHILNVTVMCVSADDSETRLFWKAISIRTFFLNPSGWPKSLSPSYTVIVIISKLASYTRRHVNSIGSERSLNDTTSLSSMFSLQKTYHEGEAFMAAPPASRLKVPYCLFTHTGADYFSPIQMTRSNVGAAYLLYGLYIMMCALQNDILVGYKFLHLCAWPFPKSSHFSCVLPQWQRD